MARLKVKQISDFTSAVDDRISNATADETASINSLELTEAAAIASINSIETVDSKQTADIATNASGVSTNASAISDLETFEGNTNTALGVLDASVDSIELVDSKQTVDIGTNATNISRNGTDISTLQGKVTQLEGDSTYRKQYATVNSTSQATIASAVEYANDDDISVFVNGHSIGYYTANTGGWSTTNGTVFTFTDIGYQLEDDDVVYVVAHA